jgi:hypothetical protein
VRYVLFVNKPLSLKALASCCFCQKDKRANPWNSVTKVMLFEEKQLNCSFACFIGLCISHVATGKRINVCEMMKHTKWNADCDFTG